MSSSRRIVNGWHRACLKSPVTLLKDCRESQPVKGEVVTKKVEHDRDRVEGHRRLFHSCFFGRSAH
jgi:hypothetical protein